MIHILQRDKVHHGSGGPQALDDEGETGCEEEHYKDDQEENAEPLFTSAVTSRIRMKFHMRTGITWVV